jgi:hypothetical protein
MKLFEAEMALKDAAISFGFARERASKPTDIKDRIAFVHAENALGQAAQVYFERFAAEIPVWAEQKRQDLGQLGVPGIVDTTKKRRRTTATGTKKSSNRRPL